MKQSDVCYSMSDFLQKFLPGTKNITPSKIDFQALGEDLVTNAIEKFKDILQIPPSAIRPQD